MADIGLRHSSYVKEDCSTSKCFVFHDLWELGFNPSFTSPPGFKIQRNPDLETTKIKVGFSSITFEKQARNSKLKKRLKNKLETANLHNPTLLIYTKEDIKFRIHLKI